MKASSDPGDPAPKPRGLLEVARERMRTRHLSLRLSRHICSGRGVTSGFITGATHASSALRRWNSSSPTWPCIAR
jgi:hypothetical protein